MHCLVRVSGYDVGTNHGRPKMQQQIQNMVPKRLFPDFTPLPIQPLASTLRFELGLRGLERMQVQMSRQKDTRQGRFNNAPNRETHLLFQFYQHADEGSGDPMRSQTGTAEARIGAPVEFTKLRT